MKKLISLVLALAMLFTIGLAFADGGDEQPAAEAPAASSFSKTMTVTNLDENDEAYFYQIAEWVGSMNYSNDGNQVITGWQAIFPYDNILMDDVLDQVLVAKPEEGGGITPGLANALAGLANSNNVTEDKKVKVGEDGIASFTTTKPGIYMVLVKPANTNTLYNPIFVSADFVNASQSQEGDGTYIDSTAKKSTLTLKKTAENKDDYNNDNAKTTAVGDIVTFKVDVTIPAYGEAFTNPYFVLKDTLTDLELTSDPITVGNLTEGTHYELEKGTNSYTITFKSGYLTSLKSATALTITYKAKVTSTALKAINEETNDVMIEYSHDPTNDTDYDVQKDTTQHYTFSIDAAGLGNYGELTGKKTSEVEKIGVDALGNPITEEVRYTEIIDEPKTWQSPLEGAKFGLWKKSDCKEGEEYKTATSDADGRLTFTGLDAGTYYLKEISAPLGFVTNNDVHTVELAATTEEVEITEYYDPNTKEWYSTNAEGRKAATYKTDVLKSYSVTIDGVNAATYSFTNDSDSSNEIQWETLDPIENPVLLPNVKGTELPHTGGIGTTIFYILGGLLVVGAVVILVARRKAQD